jgi:hypothetical protein
MKGGGSIVLPPILPMKTIKFTRDWKHAEQGMFVNIYTKDQVKEVSEECAKAALADKAGVEVGEKKPVPTVKPSEDGKLAKTPAASDDNGTAKPAPSLPPAPASPKKTSKSAGKK